MTRVTSLSTLSLLFIGLSASHDSDREFSGLIQLTQLFFFFFLIDFPLISSFNSVQLEIRLHDLFRFVSYQVISISRPNNSA
jgi:hypothetical protein